MGLPTTTTVEETAPLSTDASVNNTIKSNFECDSNEAISFYFPSLANSTTNTNSDHPQAFHPKFTYPIFGNDQRIHGFDNLKICFKLHPFSLTAYDTSITYSSKENDDANPDELLAKIKPFLPNGISNSPPQDTKPMSPSGEKVGEWDGFEVLKSSLSQDDVNTVIMRDLHQKLERLAMWFIEGADKIDTSANGNRWSVYILFEKNSCGAYAVAGYVTKFSFINPTVGIIDRICQVLVLPPYQRQGHARRLITIVTKEAATNDQVYEINVEDPVSEFSTVRDVVDYNLCCTYDVFKDVQNDTTTLRKSDIEAVRKKLKLTTRQIVRCFEMKQYAEKRQYLNDESIIKPFRLKVKRRLNSEYQVEIGGMHDPARRKSFLESKYQKTIVYYNTHILKTSEK